MIGETITKEEFQKRYGVSARETITREEYDKRFSITQPEQIQQESLPRRIFGGFAKLQTAPAELALGGAKGVGSSITGLGQLFLKGAERLPLPEQAKEAIRGGIETGEELKERVFKTTTPLEAIGKTTEQIGEFMIPVGGQLKGASLLFKMLKGGLEFAGKSAIQTGGEPVETGVSGIIGAGAPPAGQALLKAAPPIGKVLANGLSLMIGKEPEHIYRAFQNAPKVIEAMARKVIPLDVANKSIEILNNFKTKAGEDFAIGVEKLQEEANKKIIPFTQKTVSDSVGTIVNDITKGIPRIFRDMKVGVKRTGELLFDRSAVVKGGEQRNLQAVYDTIRNQKDFSPDGMQSTAARINALSKFIEGAKEESSVIISRIHDVYSKAIESTYPELGKLRNTYAVMQQQIEEIGSVLNSVKNNHLNPVQATTVAKRLSNLFKEDNEAYVRALEELEKLTGADLLNELVATEFKNLVPSTFGSHIGQLGVLGGGFFANPLILLLLPFFSPKFTGKVITTIGKNYPAFEKAPERIFRGLQEIITPTQRQIFGQ